MVDEKIYQFEIEPLYERYYSEDTYYGVYDFKTKEKLKYLKKEFDIFGDDDFYTGILVGKTQRLTIGMKYDCEAKITYNKKYKNYQYEVVKALPQKPNDLETQAKFLRSVIPESQANVVLSVYPNIVQKIIDNDYKDIDLSLTKGVKEFTFNKIVERVLENYVLADVMAFLSPLGVNINTIKRLLDNEPNPILLKKQLNTNPYILTKVHGLGFKRVDKIALQINPDLKVSRFRTKAFVEYYLKEIGESEGHTWINLTLLNQEVNKVIPECIDIYFQIIQDEQETETFIHIDDNKIGLKKYYDCERKILNILNDLENSECEIDIDEINFDKIFDEFKDEVGYELTHEQKYAVKSSGEHNVVIITAPAGAGKTSAILAILKAFKKYNISQCALSAKAAQRMKEVTGYEASTIHRLLGFNKDGFAHNENNPLESDIVIVDEASMINETLFLSLLKAVKKGAKIIIVFDYAQLPPIGAGNIATDLLKSNFTINKFTKIHRQAQKSGILMDANIIRKGINPIDKFEKNLIRGELKDMFYAFRNDKDTIFDMSIKYYMKSIEKLSVDDVIIAIPRKKDCVNSALEYNKTIQDLLLPNESQYIKRGDLIFKLGAKVIQKVNDYDKNVVNGEVGYISYIDNNKKIFNIKFGDNKEIEYSFKEIDQIELAYALTIHSCLTEDTLVLTNKGILPIKELNNGALPYQSKKINDDNILVYNGNNLEKPSHFINAGQQDCKKITTTRGYEIEITLDHKLDVLCEDGHIKYKTGDEINIGDIVVLKKNSMIFGDNLQIPRQWLERDIYCNSKTYSRPNVITEDFAKFLGYMVADGTLFKMGFRLVKEHLDIVEDFKKTVENLFGYSNGKIIKSNYENSYFYEVCSTDLVQFLSYIDGIKPHDKYVPSIIMQAPFNIQCAFLKSVFEDGAVNLKKGKFDHIELAMKNNYMAKQIQIMLLNMGIISSLTTKKKKPYNINVLYIYKKDAVLFYKYIGFINKMKNDRLKLCTINTKTSERKAIPYITNIIKNLINKYNICVNPNIYLSIKQNQITHFMLQRFLDETKEIIKDDKDYQYLEYINNNFVFEKVTHIKNTKQNTYCLTMPETHKFVQNGFMGWNCQGSQYNTVVIPLDMSSYVLLGKELVYTAITRASKRCLIISEPKAFNLGVKKKANKRNTWLQGFLVSA